MSVDDLRAQLRDRGYLTHGIERWFALDPFRSRTFWAELTLVALKAATLIAAFGAVPMVAIMLFRNSPLNAVDTLGLFASYFAAWLLVAFVFVIAVALVLKLRPALAIDTPRALLAISFAAGALLVAAIAVWWYRFDTKPALAELAVGVALCAIFFVVAATVVSAALLSFSIYELQRIPAIHQKPRGLPMSVAAAILIALLFVPAYAERETAQPETMVVTTPTTRKVALIAVDGLTYDIFQSRPSPLHAVAVPPLTGASTTERWATLGTGVPTELHGVRAIEGVRYRGGRHILQQLSRGDVVLLDLAPLLGLARREPLPPTVRRRDYVWEIVARRGVPSLAVNWWTTEDGRSGALHSIGQASIFTAAKGDALRVDAVAAQRFLTLIDREHPQFATVYLPALDVILNRLHLDLASSLKALDGITSVVNATRARGYDVIVVGLPGEGQRGQAVLATTVGAAGLAPPTFPGGASPAAPTTWDIAPALLESLGFPASKEMPGHAQERIASYGARQSAAGNVAVNEEYYENLRSLGYIR